MTFRLVFPPESTKQKQPMDNSHQFAVMLHVNVNVKQTILAERLTIFPGHCNN